MWTDLNGASTVVVDALNYLSTFLDMDVGPPDAFEMMEERVSQVAAAARGADLTLIWVFDNGQTTDEAREKWWSRRRLEVVNGERNMPVSADTFFYAALQRAGFLVLYPPEIDGDDAVALLAWKLGASVLSGDRDMLRYGLDPSKIFRTFGIAHEKPNLKLYLDPQYQRPDDGDREQRSLVELEHRLPDVLSTRVLLDCWGMKEPSMCVNARKGQTQKGNADSLTGLAGNLHRDALVLIASVYHTMGISEAVSVRLPAAVRDEHGVVIDAVLEETMVLPDASAELRAVTLDPTLTKRHLEKLAQWPKEASNRDTVQRAHAVCVIGAEIVDGALHGLGIFDTAWDECEYSSAKRVVKIYNYLAKRDSRLAPHSLSERLERLGIGENHLTPVVRCKGLRYGRGCAHDGVLFPKAVAYAEKLGKNPLCSVCIKQLPKRR